MPEEIQVTSIFERRHYQAIAERIRLVDDYSQRQQLISLFGDMFEKDNDRFDWNKFRKACKK